ncbi:MAG: acyl-CoA dehydrogenase family protein [Sneathiella sp.]|nr:acyl-CoA dehydrogenase family protein [Sneathiella sp.]
MQYSLPTLPGLVKEFGESVIKPNILKWEEERHAPRSLFNSAAKYGLLGLETPQQFGGLGATFIDKLCLARDLSHYSMAAAFSLINSQNIASRLSRSNTARHRFDFAPQLRSGVRVGCTALTEPHAGSDFAAITTTARPTKDGWIINGDKAWITNAAHADTIMLYAQTDSTKGWRGIASFLIDARAPGFKRGDIYSLMGGHTIGAGEFHLKDYFAADEDLLAPPGEAFKIAMESINGARTYVAAMCTGMIQDALSKAIAYGKVRQSFGKSLLDHQGFKWSLVDVAVQLESLTLLTTKAGQQITKGEDAVLAASMAKKVAGEITIPALTACIQAMGANGLKSETLLGHHMACAKIAAFTDGSTEMMNERIAASF